MFIANSHDRLRGRAAEMNDAEELAGTPKDGFHLLPSQRSDIATMSRAAQKAVLDPAAPGAWSAAWRHAVAARICRQHGQDALVDGYLAQAGDAVALADPATQGRDAREQAVLAFMDRVATGPKQIAEDDITRITTAGVSEPDVVRLCELAAFLAYQCRVSAGLALLAGGR